MEKIRDMMIGMDACYGRQDLSIHFFSTINVCLNLISRLHYVDSAEENLMKLKKSILDGGNIGEKDERNIRHGFPYSFSHITTFICFVVPPRIAGFADQWSRYGKLL